MEIKIPEVGESILEAMVANWVKADGAAVAKDEIICELETDKVNVELHAEASGILHIVVPVGETVPIGTVIATIEEGEVAATTATEPAPEQPPSGPETESTAATQEQATAAPVNPAARQKAKERGIDLDKVAGSGRGGRISLDDVLVHTKPVEAPTTLQEAQGEERTPKTEPAAAGAPDDGRPVTRQAMTPIRQRIAARLLQARQQTAMLTTFNEADMS